MTDVTTPAVDRQQPAHLEWPRCDRCGARAKYVVVKDGMELEFCGHHAEQPRVVYMLREGGWDTIPLGED